MLVVVGGQQQDGRNSFQVPFRQPALSPTSNLASPWGRRMSHTLDYGSLSPVNHPYYVKRLWANQGILNDFKLRSLFPAILWVHHLWNDNRQWVPLAGAAHFTAACALTPICAKRTIAASRQLEQNITEEENLEGHQQLFLFISAENSTKKIQEAIYNNLSQTSGGVPCHPSYDSDLSLRALL